MQDSPPVRLTEFDEFYRSGELLKINFNEK